jgi:predicted esterase
VFPVRALLIALLLPAVALSPARGQEDDVADVPSQNLKAGGDAKKRYFLIGPKKGTAAPEAGHGLIIVMPGGPGSAEFHPFVKRIFKYAVPDGYLMAQPVAVKWTENQQTVWPTAKLKAPQMRFTTEEFVAAVIKDVRDKHKVDAGRIFTLSWSSSGPAAYMVALTSKEVTGSLVAMSVFRPDWMPPLAQAKGHPFYLYHSPDDRVTPFVMARKAEKDLRAAGAKVELATYEGGHGWRGPLYDNLREGIAWLEKNRAGRD